MANPRTAALLVLKLVPVIAGLIIARTGFTASQPLLMVAGLFLSGVCLILFIRKFKLKMAALLTTFALVPLVAVAWSLVHQFDVENLNSITHTLELASQKHAHEINEWIEERQEDLKLIGSLNELKENPFTSRDSSVREQNISSLIENIKESSQAYKEISIQDSSGNILISTDKTAEGTVTEVKHGIYDAGLETGEPSIVISIPVTNQNWSFIISSKLDLSSIFSSISSLKLSDRVPNNTVNTYVVNSNGFFLAWSEDKLQSSGIGVSIESYLSQINNRDLFYKNFTGSRAIGAYSAVDKTGWYVITEQDYSELISVIHERSFMNPFVVLLTTFVVVIVFTLLFSFGLTKPITLLEKLMLKGSEGDLSVLFKKSRFNIIKIAEIDRMANAFNSLVNKIRTLNQSLEARIQQQTLAAEELKDANEKLYTQQDEMSVLNNNLSQSNRKLEQAFNEMKATQSHLVEHENRIIDNIKHISELSSGILGNMQVSSEFLHKGDQSINLTTKQMENISSKMKTLQTFTNELNHQSKNIDAVNETISYIANQTQLLALNATIESAKAGSSGQGFAVIASEISKLSVQSSSASKQISDLIKQVISNIEAVVKEMEEGIVEVNKGMDLTIVSKGSFDNISQSILSINSSIEEIASAASDISRYSHEFAAYLGSINKKLDIEISDSSSNLL